MDYTTQLEISNVENPHELDWLYFEDTYGKIFELPPIDDFFEFDSASLPYNNMSVELKNFEAITGGSLFSENNLSSSYEDIQVEAKPLNTTKIVSFGQCYNVKSEISEVPMMLQSDCATPSMTEEETRVIGRKRSCPLELEEIQKYFDVPITRAAKEMKVGLTVLKKRCRELNILRWPHRKIKSLKSLINNVKELGLTNEIVMLEEHKRLLEKVPDMELTDQTKKLRQACFKANYKKRRFVAAHA